MTAPAQTGARSGQSNLAAIDRQRIRSVVRQDPYALVAGVLSFNRKPNNMEEAVFYDSCRWPIDSVILDKKRGWGGDPRGHLKTTRWTIGLPLWLSIQTPNEQFDSPEEYTRARAWLKANPWFTGVNTRILVASASKETAQLFLGQIRRIYEQHTLFRWLFPELCPENNSDLRWNQDGFELPGRTTEYVEAYCEPAGVVSRTTGRHYNLVIVDDLVHENNWKSPNEIQAGIDWLLLAEHLLETPDISKPLADSIIAVGNYWTRYDVRGFVEDNLGTTYDIWHRACWQCSRCGTDRCLRSADCTLTDIPLWQTNFTRDGLLEQRKRQGTRIFTAQMLNDPQDPDVVSFRRSDIRWCMIDQDAHEVALFREDSRHVEERIPFSAYHWFLAVDPATSTDPRSCRSAIGVFGEDPQGRLVLADLIADRLRPEDLVTTILDLWDEHIAAGRRLTRLGTESYGGQRHLLPAINFGAQLRGNLLLSQPYDARLGHIYLYPTDNNTRKEDRVTQLLGWRLESHTLYVNTTVRHKEILFHEIDAFPNSRSNDIVDMIASAQTMCRGSTNRQEAVARNRRRAARFRRRQTTATYGGW